MTRLSEALKRAAETAHPPFVANEDLPPAAAASPATTWQFAPVETMHVPDEPPHVTVDDFAGGAALAVAPSAGPELDAPVDPQLDQFVPAEPAPAIAERTITATEPIRVGDADRDKLIVGNNVDSALLEQDRHLAAVLHHAQKSTGVRSVMVTSALPSEGKTLTATNLALTLSQSYQRRVLLIDADLRRPRMREMFAIPEGEGLTDSLSAPRQGGRLPVHQVSPHLWVLTSGSLMVDPMSTLISPAMKQLLDDAREAFDWVVVDTPPIAILPDANLLAAMIDTTLLVVSAQSTPYPMVQRAAQAVGTSRILGVVLNRAEKAGLNDSYGYYGSSARTPAADDRRWFRRFRKARGVPAATK